jgi:hypothetical protein
MVVAVGVFEGKTGVGVSVSAGVGVSEGGMGVGVSVSAGVGVSEGGMGVGVSVSAGVGVSEGGMGVGVSVSAGVGVSVALLGVGVGVLVIWTLSNAPEITHKGGAPLGGTMPPPSNSDPVQPCPLSSVNDNPDPSDIL